MPTIKAENVATLKARIARLNKRAAKLNLPAFSATFSDPYLAPIPGNERKCREVVDVTLQGNAPVINGWTVAAILEPLAPNANLIRGILPSIPESFRSAPMTCEHCHTHRPRAKCVVLFSASEGWKQVGSSCLADYVRSSDAATALAIWSLYFEIETQTQEEEEESEDLRKGTPSGYRLDIYLAMVAYMIRKDGWRPRSKFEDTSTSQLADIAFDKNPSLPTPEDHATAQAAIAWTQTLTPKSDYEHNLKLICSSSFVRFQDLAFAASAVATYLNSLAKPNVTKGHFGTVGSRLDFSLTVTHKHVVETMFGLKTILTFNDSEGYQFVWKATTRIAINQGDQIQLKGTIKEHSEFRNTPQTVLTRCTLKA